MRFGSSGIRSRYGRELVSTSLLLGHILGEKFKEIIVGRDTRTTSRIIENAFIAGVLSGGSSLRTAGLVPTPAVASSITQGGSGCMITASHNPEEYNGLKIFNHGGSSLFKTQQKEIEELLVAAGKPADHHAFQKSPGRVTSPGILDTYIQKITARFPSERMGRMILDCGNGAGSVASPAILREMGADIRCINCTPSGFFTRPSEPLEQNLGYLPPLITAWKASGAVVHDGDADRMMAFDSRGRYITGDQMLILFCRYLDAQRVVTTTDASMAIDEWAEVRRTPVGDSYVSEALAGWGDFGGEPSGAWIFPRQSLCPDGPYAAALFCQMASEWDIAAELDRIPVYPIRRRSLPCSCAHEVMHSLGAASPTDGIRISRDEGWYLVRASGTEPKIRITAEGRTPAAADALLDEGTRAVREWKSKITHQ
ncbi:MAG: phosphoglucomutase [Methanolinea sp.]|nr:phosphoglucomutase [Methanolinea sp.]